MESAKSKEVADEYISSLADLSVNSKPLITMLTMLAEESMEHAPAIVQAVEAHLQKVRSDCKLPVLYLIDSIVKNVKGNYLNLFSQNIVNTFCSVFEEVDEATRASMFKLRQTWYNVFPANKLYLLDLRVNSVDPAWPIRPLPASVSGSSIHVNPRFFAMSRQSTTATAPVPLTNLPSTNTVITTEAAMREQLLKKERELLELQKKKIELELLQAKASLEQQQRQLYKQVVNLKTEPTVRQALATLPTENTQENPAESNTPSQVPKTPSKQFPAATASLLKNVGTSNGPRIAPASSIAVASARSMLRDPRLKVSTSGLEQNASQTDPRLRPGISDEKESSMEEQTQASVPIDNTVLSEQLKQQLLLKQAGTSTINKPPSIVDGSNISLLIASSNNNANANLNVNNKNSSGNANKDAVSHRKSQKKEPRSSSNSSGNLTVNNSKVTQNQPVNNSTSPVSSASSRGGGGSESKLKDSKNSNNRGSLVSESDKSFASSKSSHRKVGTKSRSKQPHSSPNKVLKLERNVSPVRSKSREKENEDSSPSLRASPQSSSQSSKNRKKTIKSRKRSPSPYRIPKRNEVKSNTSSSSSGGLTEEEQSGSLIVSPPHPPAFKEIRPSARQRNYIRRNKEGSLSPEPSTTPVINQALSEPLLESSSKDEDLRASLPLPVTTTASSVSEKKEDLDLRVLPPVSANKRQSSEHVEPTIIKKSKVEKFDALFGNEDVDLRMLTNPNAGRPPTPPPPVISGDEGKDSWAKLKTPSKNNDRDIKTEKPITEEKRDRDRSRDPLGRPRLYSKLPDDPKERRRTLSNEDQEPRFGRRGRDADKHERNPDRNIEIILKQAAEQLSQGAISKADYNKLIQEVLHMSELQKLKAAQRQEKEVGSLVWEKGSNLDVKNRMSGFPIKDGEHHRKDYPIGRNEGGSRWQNQPWQRPGPWAHPPGPPFGGPQGHFNPDYRPLGPWQNPRHFGPMRPDFNQFHGGFNPNIGPRMGPGMMGPMGPNGPIMPNMIPNGPLGPMGMGNSPLQMSGMGPGSMMMNGPMGKMMHSTVGPMGPLARNSSPSSTPKYDIEENEEEYNGPSNKNVSFSCELPMPDQKLLDEITHDVMRSIKIDSIEREIRYYGQTAVVFMSWDDPREIGFQDGVRRVLIDDKETITCAFNEPYKEFLYMEEVHRIKLGGPTRELYIDDRWYECYFGGPAISINLGGKIVNVKLEGPSPQVKIGSVKRTDLVVGKINLIINAKDMVPVFLDAKPQKIKIEGKPHTLEFTDALQTVLLNGHPFKVEFGDLPKPIIVGSKKHFIRFTVLPRGVRAGHVKITGMRGDAPMESPPISPRLNQNLSIENTPASASMPSTIEHDSCSQDGSDFTSSTPKPNLQLDMLSSVLPSAMAPSSGLSYQAEPTENPPAPAPVLNLNMDELFQRLVETGIVANLSEPKKQEEPEKEKPEIIPVSFDDDKSLKVKQPAVIALLYNGMQCSSCGSRYATPELTSRYSQHLDWHFRQNRKGRDSQRKAHSRTFYYDLSDWTQYEEVEDLEDRAQSWFETEKQTTEVESAVTEDLPEETEQPSVPTGSATELRCHVCHDEFKQFYNEEMEEWHIKPAIVFEGNNFHPFCLEDHKEKLLVRALEKSAEALEALVASEEQKDLISEVVETSEEVEVKEREIEKMDEVETVLQDEESVAETDPDIVVTEPPPAPVIEAIDLEAEENEIIENVEGKQPTIEGQELVEDVVRIDQPLEKIKIKEEPSDEAVIPDKEEFIFTDVEIKEEPIEPEPEPEPEESIERTEVDTTHAAMKSTIDGNVELESAPATIPAASSKIKINITKPMVANREPEEQKEIPIVESPEIENTTPLKPASMKPFLKGRQLQVFPPIEKGEEMSGFCSIM